jgi:MFS family permease
MTVQPVDRARVHAATRATAVAFIGSGFAFASWASRIPQVRDALRLDPSELGLVLLAIAVGSVLALPLAGPVVTRLGSRRAVTSMAWLLSAALLLVAVGYHAGVLPVVVGLFLLGFANGLWDVGMNVQGALVERAHQRSLMARFHAGWSVGTVAGALVGTALVALEVSVTAHLATVAVVVGVAVVVAVRGFLPDAPDAESPPHAAAVTPDTPAVSAWAAWREPRTLAIGLFVLAFAYAEGVANDWISVAVIDAHDVPDAVGTLAFSAFLVAMTTGRWFGPALLDRFGRVPVLRASAAVAIAGIVVTVSSPAVWLLVAGVLLWGAGTALGFPVGMSAGADEPERAAARVGVIASIGYCAFLAGPPLVGFLGEQVTVIGALFSVAVVLAGAMLLAPRLREPDRGTGGQSPAPGS